MPVSTVHVQYRSGTPARGVRVTLGFVGFAGGVTRPAFTNYNGEAVIEHASAGYARVYVSGKSYHTFHAPGRTGVQI